jgi:hypothetical protein
MKFNGYAATLLQSIFCQQPDCLCFDARSEVYVAERHFHIGVPH